jgi:aspartate/methionine/tyrosine aminotransferase
MTLKVAARGQVPPFMVMDVMRDAAALESQGRRIVHLEVGQPSTGIPRAAAAKLAPLIDREALGYTLADGIPRLRAGIADHHRATYGVGVEASRVFVTTGSSAGFQLSFMAAFDIGDRVALAAPGYPAYRHILTSLGVDPVLIPVDAATRFQITIDHLKALRPLPDGVIVASPSNPTGTMVLAEDFRALVAYCHDAGIRLISDEIYHGITYDAPGVSAADLSPSAIVINSFSKYFSMTGWRVGWMIVPDDLKRAMECLAQNHFISPPALSQWGALHALDCRDELERNVAVYRRNRAALLKRLPELGLAKIAPSDGAFYAYVDISGRGEDSVTFCRRMLNEAGVATTPGADFDPFRGDKFVRISFAVLEAEVAEALSRLETWVRPR